MLIFQNGVVAAFDEEAGSLPSFSGPLLTVAEALCEAVTEGTTILVQRDGGSAQLSVEMFRLCVTLSREWACG